MKKKKLIFFSLLIGFCTYLLIIFISHNQQNYTYHKEKTLKELYESNHKYYILAESKYKDYEQEFEYEIDKYSKVSNLLEGLSK